MALKRWLFEPTSNPNSKIPFVRKMRVWVCSLLLLLCVPLHAAPQQCAWDGGLGAPCASLAACAPGSDSFHSTQPLLSHSHTHAHYSRTHSSRLRCMAGRCVRVRHAALDAVGEHQHCWRAGDACAATPPSVWQCAWPVRFLLWLLFVYFFSSFIFLASFWKKLSLFTCVVCLFVLM